MLAIRYHRQLARSIYIWGVFTPNDFGVLILGLAFNVLILGSNAFMVLILAGYPAYLAAFRLGRPPGNDAHYFRSFRWPRLLRPGRAEPRRGWRTISPHAQAGPEISADE